MVVAAMVLRAWRREVLVARALVNSSNLEGSIFVRSFHSERVVPPGARSAPGARIVIVDACEEVHSSPPLLSQQRQERAEASC
ncbi:MAG: hypothetical protein ACJ797_06210 [Ktedonobacteraceae bacterium]